MNAIVVGDLHGDLQLYKKIRKQFELPLILVGDLLDSFKFSRTEQFHLLKTVIEDIEAGRTQCLLGNHELSYMDEYMRCPGWDKDFQKLISPLIPLVEKLFKPYILDQENALLIAHAGISKAMILEYAPQVLDEDQALLNLDALQKFLDDELWHKYGGYTYHRSHARGGTEKHGGIFWSDWFWDFVPIPGLNQILGHTPVSEITQRANCYNIDCLQYRTPQFLEVNNNHISMVQL